MDPGVSSGIIENFAYVRISEVGGSRGNCLGVCRLVSSLAGGPIFYLSGAITNKIGINNVLSLSLLSYVLRFMNYAIINNPWQALPAEVLRGVTFGLFWSASTYYIYNESPKALTASMLSLVPAYIHTYIYNIVVICIIIPLRVLSIAAQRVLRRPGPVPGQPSGRLAEQAVRNPEHLPAVRPGGLGSPRALLALPAGQQRVRHQ